MSTDAEMACCINGHDDCMPVGQTQTCCKSQQVRDRQLIIGGMVTSTIHVLIITPVIFSIMKVPALRKGTPGLSGMISPVRTDRPERTA